MGILFFCLPKTHFDNDSLSVGCCSVGVSHSAACNIFLKARWPVALMLQTQPLPNGLFRGQLLSADCRVIK